MSWWQYALRRTALALSTMLAASLVLFVLLMLRPDPLAQLQQESDVDTAALAERYGWNDPWPVQYWDWLSGFVQGDWGSSIQSDQPAMQMILERAPLTLALTSISTLLAAVAAVIVGSWTARRRGSRADTSTMKALIAVGALPSFLLALLLQWGAVKMKDITGVTIAYVGGMPRDGGLVEYVQRLVLPILALTIMQFVAWTRFQRSELMGVLDDDTTTAARARGLDERTVLRRHALPRTAAPMLTLIGLELGTMIGGSIVVENVFSLPGLGRLLLDSVDHRDVVVALDIVVLGAALITVVSALVDIVSARIDPRVAIE